MSSGDDLRTAARIRDAAIVRFGDHGIRATTIRAIAQEAGVSPGLVMHHFGSKEGLREACDAQVTEVLTIAENDALAASGQTNPMAQLRAHAAVLNYLNASLVEGGHGADRLFGQLCDLTATLLTSGQMPIKPSADRDATVATVVAFSCGAAILGTQLAHRLGGERLTDPQVYLRYAVAAVEVLTDGLLADDTWLTIMRQAAALIADPDPPRQPDPTTDPSAST
ncbi:MAG: TetR family transcriptional regulator [Propioniciclava sp.]